MMSKKASMELGISTVVVLVIAMVIIAGGIAFIRGFFKLGTERLGGAFNVGDFGVQPTSVDPLVLVDGSPSIKSGKTENFKVGFYNTGSSPVTTSIKFTDCVSTATNTGCYNSNNPLPIIKSLSQTVDQGNTAGFENFLTAKCYTTSEPSSSATTNLAAGDYICTIVAAGAGNDPAYASKQITFTVES